ncbi:MAG: O-antigen ligase family protein [Microthrixaceae bacterium]
MAFLQVVAFLIHFDGIGVGPITLGRGMSIAILCVIVYKLLAEKWRPPAVPVRHWIGPLVLITWGIISGAWSTEVGAWFIGLGTFGLGIAYFLAAALLVDSFDRIQQFLRAYWYGGIFGAVAGIWGLILGLRAYGFNGDANLFGVLAASMIPLTIYYRRNAANANQKLVYTGVLLLVLVGSAGAGSRSGVIGAAVALFGSLVYRPGTSVRKRVASVVPAALVTTVIALVLLFMNPKTIERGTDSSGRLDFWKVTIELIQERPVEGHGLRQINSQIPPRLATTPGTEKHSDKREDVTSHNTWLDLAGDLGFVGFVIFAFIIGVTALGLLRPRWAQTKEVSGYLFVMFLPVLSGSMFLAVQNNKLAWSIIGLAGALQVPSWGVRYRGYFSRPRSREPQSVFAAPKLARWDLRISQRFRVYTVLGALGGALVLGLFASGLPTKHSATVSLMVPRLEIPPGLPRVPIDDARVSSIQTLVLSDAYGARLAELSGVQMTPSEASERVEVNRPDFGPYLEISFTDSSEEVVAAVAPQMLGALDELITEGREFTTPSMRDELRPTIPGEQRFYSGPLYLVVSETPDLDATPPPTAWLVFVGAASGTMLAVGYGLLMQRRPRVNNDDDFESSLGLPLWSHVGRSGRRNAATVDQYSQVAVRAFEASGSPGWPRRIVVAAPRPSRSVRSLALGMASAMAAGGQKVVLVDAQVRRPWPSLRLASWHRRGLTDLLADGAASTRSCAGSRPGPPAADAPCDAQGARENLRFVSAGRFAWGGVPAVEVSALGDLDPSVTAIVLAPPVLGTVAVGNVLGWADVVLYDVVEGSTVTFDAEDGALQVATFAPSAAGVVLSDV